VRSFPVIQQIDYSILLLIVPESRESPFPRAVNMAVDPLEAATGHEVPVVLEIRDAIESDQGKTRYLLSELS
jgi:hypothetical protein